MNFFSFYVNDSYCMEKLSKLFSRLYILNTIVFLFGDFGSGKTFFVKSLLTEFFFNNLCIRSPSYSFIDIYFFDKLYFYHLDFYRNCDVKRFSDLFFDFFLNDNFIFFIEWGEKLFGNLLRPDVCIFIFYYSFFNRIVIVKSRNINFTKLLS